MLSYLNRRFDCKHGKRIPSGIVRFRPLILGISPNQVGAIPCLIARHIMNDRDVKPEQATDIEPALAAEADTESRQTWPKTCARGAGGWLPSERVKWRCDGGRGRRGSGRAGRRTLPLGAACEPASENDADERPGKGKHAEDDPQCTR